MSTFENDQYRWRETYFVLFDAAHRPKLKAVEKRLQALNGRFILANAEAGDRGLIESLTVVSPDDFAALDISYLDGDEVREQVETLARELDSPDCRGPDRARLKRLRAFTARFDVLHFEQLPEYGQEEDDDEMLDPGTLLVVLQALAEITGGIAVDPQAGAML